MEATREIEDTTLLGDLFGGGGATRDFGTGTGVLNYAETLNADMFVLSIETDESGRV